MNTAHALDVSSVRFGSYPDKVRMVLELDQTSEFRAFILDNPYRLVIDLPEFNWKVGVIDKYQQAGIIDVRQGRLQRGFSRIVFDLKRAAAIKNAFSIARNGNTPSRIVIDYAPIPPHEFAQKKDAIFGTLSLNTNTAPAPTIAQNQNTFPIPSSKPDLPPMQQTDLNQGAQYKPLIVIDPGHGGVDPGAIGANKLYEKTVVLDISKELRQQLLNTGRYRVEMTRDDDDFIKLRDRVAFARKHGADLFISIHADSTPQHDTHGTSVYTLSKKASDQQTALLAEKENSADLLGGIDLNVEDEQVAYILGDFLMTDTMNQSKYFANTLVSKLNASGIDTLQNPHRYAGFAVLKAPDIPSVLIEAGFMSNLAESNLLNQKQHRKKLASAILKGINAYFEQVNKNELSE